MSDYIEKYYIKDKGLTLEKSDPDSAIAYYKGLLSHDYFRDDYYIYRRLVMMYEKIHDDSEKTTIIRKFFKSRIYANEYNYLWFKYRLDSLTDMGFITQQETETLINYYKNSTFKTDPSPPIADRIKKQKGEIIIESEEKYDKRQTRYAYEARVGELNRQKKYRESVGLLNHMIDDVGYRRYEYFKKLCICYRRLGEPDMEMKTIERYYNGESTRTKLSEAWFEKRLKDLTSQNQTILDLPGNLGDNPLYEYDDSLTDMENLKRKAIMIEYAKTLSTNDAILYYKYLTTNSYFSNDCYPYIKLSEIYDETGDYHGDMVNVRKLLYSKIHLNDYQFLFFSDRIRVLLDRVDGDENTVRKWLDYYEMHGALNRHKENSFAADKFIIENGEVTVLSDDDYEKSQKELYLKKTGSIYESVGNYELAANHYTRMIYDGEFNLFEIHLRLWECLEKMNDCKRLARALRLYRIRPPQDRNAKSDECFERQLRKVDEKKSI